MVLSYLLYFGVAKIYRNTKKICYKGILALLLFFFLPNVTVNALHGVNLSIKISYDFCVQCVQQDVRSVILVRNKHG